MTRILILRNKHSTEYYDASTQAQLDTLLLQIVRDRYGPGGIFEIRKPRPNSRTDEKHEYKLLQGALAGTAGCAATLMNRRRNAEYEGWELAEVRSGLSR